MDNSQQPTELTVLEQKADHPVHRNDYITDRQQRITPTADALYMNVAWCLTEQVETFKSALSFFMPFLRGDLTTFLSLSAQNQNILESHDGRIQQLHLAHYFPDYSFGRAFWEHISANPSHFLPTCEQNAIIQRSTWRNDFYVTTVIQYKQFHSSLDHAL